MSSAEHINPHEISEKDPTKKKASSKRNKEVVISPAFAAICTEKLRELKINPRMLSTKVGIAYDSIRRTCKGVSFAGPKLLSILCQELDLDQKEMEYVIHVDKVSNMGGIHMDNLEDLIDPDLLKINEIFVRMHASDRKEIIDDIKTRFGHLADTD